MEDALGGIESGLVHFGLGNDEESHSSEIALEETMTVCIALANFCGASPAYAEKLLGSGLMIVMLELVNSSHVTIAEYALRCVSSMCPIVATSPTERISIVSQRKSTLSVEILRVLTAALESQNSHMQRVAVEGLAKLCLNRDVHDLIMQDAFRMTVNLVLQDRESRNAVEEVRNRRPFLKKWISPYT